MLVYKVIELHKQPVRIRRYRRGRIVYCALIQLQTVIVDFLIPEIQCGEIIIHIQRIFKR